MMIDLNPPARLPSLAEFALPGAAGSESPASDPFDLRTAITRATNAAPDGVLEAKKKRIRLLRKQIEQLQQRLRKANERLAMVQSAARHRTTDAHMQALSAARAQAQAASSALSMAQVALFQAESAVIGSEV
ncbi:BZIP domain-containing protein [Pseudomonas chlororaphis]|nr:hypothetical protein F7R16_16560 [Pseudomonas chlororaphis subsp. aureofaciens]PWY52998.1 hypothetical protein DK261_00555 [Pseudomonas sp. RW409]TSD32257.1 hypothetical protein FCE86_022665 [Pseudomonas sp. ATCC 13985]